MKNIYLEILFGLILILLWKKKNSICGARYLM